MNLVHVKHSKSLMRFLCKFLGHIAYKKESKTLEHSYTYNNKAIYIFQIKTECKRCGEQLVFKEYLHK